MPPFSSAISLDDLAHDVKNKNDDTIIVITPKLRKITFLLLFDNLIFSLYLCVIFTFNLNFFCFRRRIDAINFRLAAG